MFCKINSYLKYVSLASFIFFNSYATADECEVIPMLVPPKSIITQPYIGDCKDGKAEGKGSYQFKQTSNDRLVFVQGEFKNGMLNGNGSINFKGALGKSKIEGNYIDNLMDGNGTASYEKFGVYKNQWKNGRLLYGHEISQLSDGAFVIRLYTNGYLDKTCRDSAKIDDFCTAELKAKLKNDNTIELTKNDAEKSKQLHTETQTVLTPPISNQIKFESVIFNDECDARTVLARINSADIEKLSTQSLTTLTEKTFTNANIYYTNKCNKYLKNLIIQTKEFQIYLVPDTYQSNCKLTGQGSANLNTCLMENGAISALGKGTQVGGRGTYVWNKLETQDDYARSQKILNELIVKYKGKIYYRGDGYHFNKSILIGVPASVNLRASSLAIPFGNEIKKILDDRVIYQDNGVNKIVKYIGVAFDDDIKFCGNIEAIGCIERIIWIGSNLGSNSVVKAINYEIDEKEKSEKLKIANAIKNKADEKTKVLVKRTNAEGWRSLQLKTNAFAHEGKIYLFNTTLTKMDAADSGIFNGDYYFSNIPKNAIVSNNQLVIVGKVIGVKSVKTPFGGEISIPHMRYVGHEFCAETDCKDFTGLK